MITVVNMIPRSLSGETNQDSEPNLAVNPANPLEIAGSAFTPDPMGGPNAPIFVSSDGGNTWLLNSIVPSQAGNMTGDITVRFSRLGNRLYAGILRRPGSLRLNILRTNDFMNPATMAVLVDRRRVDQPYVQATTVGGQDRVYVGDNDFAAAGGRTATIDQSLNAAIPAPLFPSIRIESRGTSGQDGPPIRAAVHPDDTVYAAFYGWRRFTGRMARTDVVVVRDDNGGMGATPFTALVDTDGQSGVRVVRDRNVPWANFSQPAFGQERFVGSNLSIAVDPRNSAFVFAAWADRVGSDDYTLHVRRSTDRGVTWSDDLRTVTNATNPALAINDAGTVGFLYQQIVGGVPAAQRWETHIELTDDAFGSVQDSVLADVPAAAPAPQFIPYIGDYVHLMAVESDFYGIFSANNTPDLGSFPQGVTYQRLADFNTHVLMDLAGRRVPVSIDPFFFRLTPPSLVTFEYAAKFICGIQREPEGTRLARGLYATTVNVHNPNDKRVRFFKKLALTYPPGAQKPGEVLRIGFDVLAPDQALAVDCEDIQRRLFPNGFPAPYIEGFIVIESPMSLDVTAVYTTAALDRAGRPTDHSSIDVEQVRERQKGGAAGLPDLIPVPDSSGSFCRIRDGQLLVTVRNQGSGLAGPSVTRVDFGAFGAVDLPTPALPQGASVDLLAAIPPGCFNPDCAFRITVDATSQVTESNEANNTASGTCIG